VGRDANGEEDGDACSGREGTCNKVSREIISYGEVLMGFCDSYSSI